MDPQELIQKQVQKHFPKFGKMRKVCMYTPQDNPSYDDDTGAKTDNPQNPETVRIIFMDFDMTKSYSADGYNTSKIDIKTDKKGLFPSLNLSVVPEAGDTVLRQDTSQTFEVIGLMNDPAEATRLLHLRLV